MNLSEAFMLALDDAEDGGDVIEIGTVDDSIALITRYEVLLVEHAPGVPSTLPMVTYVNAMFVRECQALIRPFRFDATAMGAWLDGCVPEEPSESCPHCGNDGCPIEPPQPCAWTRYHTPQPVSVCGLPFDPWRFVWAVPFFGFGQSVQVGVIDRPKQRVLLVKGEGWSWFVSGLDGERSAARAWPVFDYDPNDMPSRGYDR